MGGKAAVVSIGRMKEETAIHKIKGKGWLLFFEVRKEVMNPQAHTTHTGCLYAQHLLMLVVPLIYFFSEFVVFHWKSSAVSLSDVEAVVCLARGIS